MSKKYSFFLISLAVLVGVLYAAPQFLIRQSAVASGQPFVLSQFYNISDEAHIYFQRAREVYDGGFPARDISFDGNRPNLFPTIPALVFYPFIAATGGDLNSAYILLSFVVPAILFLLFYFLGQSVFERNKIWSIFFALIGTLTPLAIHSVRALLSPANFSNIVIKNFYPGISTILDKLFLNRIDDPLITYLVFLPAILFLLLFWQKPSRLNAIFAGLFAGLLFHAYFHYWVYWVIVLAGLFVFSIIFLRNDKLLVKHFLVLAGVAVLVSGPYWINYLQARSAPGYDEYAARVGVEVGRKISWAYSWPDYLAYLGMAAVVYFVFWRRGHQKTAVLFFIFLGAIFLAWNIQLFTGFVPQPDHFRKAIGPVFLIMAFAALYEITKKIEAKKIGAILLLGSVLLIGKKVVNASLLISPPQDLADKYTQPAELVNSWNWIDSDLLGEPRILSNSFLSSFYLSGLTSARPFLSWGVISPGPNFDLEERFLVANKIFGLSAEAIRQRLVGNQEDELLGIYEHFYEGSGDVIPAEKISELVVRYQKLTIDWEKLPADYIYYGPNEMKFRRVDFSANKNLELVYDRGGVQIYKIKR